MVVFSAIRSSFSSSEVLNGRREPVVGDGDLVDCAMVDFGRYLGSPEPIVLERRVTVRAPVSKVFEDCSSMETRPSPPETRRRVTVLDSGVSVRLMA